MSITTGTSRERPDLADHLEPVDVREADVEQDDVRVIALHDIERRLTGPRADDVDLAPLQGEPEADGFDDVRLVVDDQDPHQAGLRRPVGRHDEA